MEQKQEEQKYKFTDEERKPILKEKFKVGIFQNACDKKSLEEIIDDVINVIKKSDKIKNCIKKYWFTKQIEEWKKNNNKEPNEDELMNIVKEDLKVRMVNTMLELKQLKGINQGDIWFYQNRHHVGLKQNDDYICEVSYFNWHTCHISPPYKPFFMKNQNDNYKLNGVCIHKHGNDDEYKTKWIMACFKDEDMEPQCKITFQTNEDNKITNVKIETKKDSSSKSTYTISLNKEGKVKKITKKGEEENANQNYTEEIKRLLFEDNTNKHLTENIELELDKKQKEVFDTIKKHIGVVKEENKEEDNNNCKCCGFDLSCLKSCKGIFY